MRTPRSAQLPPPAAPTSGDDRPYWSLSQAEALSHLGASATGLSSVEASTRAARLVMKRIGRHHAPSTLAILARQFGSPTIVIMLVAAALSAALGEHSDAAIIIAIVVASGMLGFVQEARAANSMTRLLARVRTTATVLRDGTAREVSFEDVVVGDVMRLSAGDLIAADAVVLTARGLLVDEAALTGESIAVDKEPTPTPADAPLAARRNVVHLGTHVVSGTGTAIVAAVGTDAEYGAIAKRLRLRPPESAFERGIRHFGYLLGETTFVMIVAIFALNAYAGHPIVEALLFSLAIAVGMTPQLLPAIVGVTLAQGARRLARDQVVVKRLSAIENLGSMDVLCCDKTGTITEGVVAVSGAFGADGAADDDVLSMARLNAMHQDGYRNPIDAALVAGASTGSPYEKLDEIPYDFARKRLTVVVRGPQGRLQVTKGAADRVLDACRTVRIRGEAVPLAPMRPAIEAMLATRAADGTRVLGVATRRDLPDDHADERDLEFIGFLALSDPLRRGIAETIARLRSLGVRTKLVSGDARAVAAAIAAEAGIATARVVVGADVATMPGTALRRMADEVDVFAEIEPTQKERIILALKQAGRVVGYIGDGINDAAALHAADVGISVDSAVDVAREASDVVLLRRDLAVIEQGVRGGRATFANTMKYVLMATSANFGNMVSVALASAFLPFLPMLPKQILVVNALTDLPEMTIATDRVDAQAIERPQRWHLPSIRWFMIVFGLLSSLFDLLTFVACRWTVGLDPVPFRSTWFIESIVSAGAVALVVRTRRPFFLSRPSRWLALAAAAVVIVAVILPSTRVGRALGLSPLPARSYLAVSVIVVTYLVAAEVAKVALRYRRPATGRDAA